MHKANTYQDIGIAGIKFPRLVVTGNGRIRLPRFKQQIPIRSQCVNIIRTQLQTFPV